MEGIILSFKRGSNWSGTNIWLVKFRVRIRGKIEEREKYVTGIGQCSNDGTLNMEAALAVAALYGGKRVRILSTRFVDTAARAGFDFELVEQRWKSDRTA